MCIHNHFHFPPSGYYAAGNISTRKHTNITYKHGIAGWQAGMMATPPPPTLQSKDVVTYQQIPFPRYPTTRLPPPM